MATLLKIFVGGVEQANLNNSPYLLVSFYPKEPKQDDKGNYDLSDIWDEIVLVVRGASRDVWVENKNKLENLLVNAARYQDRLVSSAHELAYQPRDGSYTLYSEIKAGWVEGPREPQTIDDSGVIAERVVLHVLRRATWEMTEQTVALTTTPSDNGANNKALLPTLLGQLPARCYLYFTIAGGNSANCKRAVVSQRTRGTPSAFEHWLKVAGMGTGWSVTAGSGVAIAADANFISGSKATYTPSNTNLNEILRWEYTPATPADTKKQFVDALALLRYRDNAASPNFKFQLDLGVKVGSSYVYAPSTSGPIKTKMNGGTTEIGTLDLALARVPSVGSPDLEVVTLVYRLKCQALQTGSTVDVDALALHPLSEASPGKGLAVAEFPAAIASNRVYFDFRTRRERAYLANGSSVKLVGASDWIDGGEILLMPGLAEQCLYLGVMTEASNNFKHDKSVTFGSVTLVYKPRYVTARGSTT